MNFILGKLKVHELAKELGVPSKEVLEKAKELKIEVASHLSNLEEEQVSMIKKAYSNNAGANKTEKKANATSADKKVEKKAEKKDDTAKKQANKNKKETPVIIRREVILNDESDNK